MSIEVKVSLRTYSAVRDMDRQTTPVLDDTFVSTTDVIHGGVKFNTPDGEFVVNLNDLERACKALRYGGS